MLMRFDIQLAIPKDVYDAIPLAKKIADRDAIRALKALAVKVNEGKDNEEMTIRAVSHICRHDENKPCEPEEEV